MLKMGDEKIRSPAFQTLLLHHMLRRNTSVVAITNSLSSSSDAEDDNLTNNTISSSIHKSPQQSRSASPSLPPSYSPPESNHLDLDRVVGFNKHNPDTRRILTCLLIGFFLLLTLEYGRQGQRSAAKRSEASN